MNLDSHNINHANSLSTISPIYTDCGIETRYINKLLREVATIYASLINQYKFKNHIILSPSSYKIEEEYRRNDQIELFINLIINHKSTENDINDIDVKSQL